MIQVMIEKIDQANSKPQIYKLCVLQGLSLIISFSTKINVNATDIKELQIHQRGLQIQAFERNVLSNIIILPLNICVLFLCKILSFIKLQEYSTREFSYPSRQRSGKTVSRLACRSFSQKTKDEFVLFTFLLFMANKTNSSVCFLGESTVCQSAFWYYLTIKTWT